MARPAMISLAALVGVQALAGCDGPDRTETRKIFTACAAATSALRPEVEAVLRDERSDSGSAAARRSARTCAESGRRLSQLDAQHPCLPTIRSYETLNEAVAEELAGLGGLPAWRTLRSGLDRYIEISEPGCHRAIGIG